MTFISFARELHDAGADETVEEALAATGLDFTKLREHLDEVRESNPMVLKRVYRLLEQDEYLRASDFGAPSDDPGIHIVSGSHFVVTFRFHNGSEAGNEPKGVWTMVYITYPEYEQMVKGMAAKLKEREA